MRLLLVFATLVFCACESHRWEPSVYAEYGESDWLGNEGVTADADLWRAGVLAKLVPIERRVSLLNLPPLAQVAAGGHRDLDGDLASKSPQAVEAVDSAPALEGHLPWYEVFLRFEWPQITFLVVLIVVYGWLAHLGKVKMLRFPFGANRKRRR